MVFRVADMNLRPILKAAKPGFKTSSRRSSGFTIIELLVATLVFSIVLLVILAAFIQISRLFYKGVNMNNTQESARVITQDIASDIQFSPTGPSPSNFVYTNSSTPAGQFCVGVHRYTYKIGHQLGTGPTASDYGVVRDTIGTTQDCPDYTRLAQNAGSKEELLDTGMQLNSIGIKCTVGRCTVSVHVVFYGGDNNVFSTKTSAYNSTPWLAPDAECTGSLQSSQFCATADYDRTVGQPSSI
jgi:prepilin-type N-terminal cleavage/methylation domain-containing protein